LVIAIFRSRVRPESLDAYLEYADEMADIARSMPGFISWKAYFAEDGERLSFHEWESEECLRAWREHPQHVAAQRRGRADFYEEYTLYVCSSPRESRYP
jgi:heme-degrading monooxygenase HmoA